ncbi:MAG: TonB-dependent receptor [Bacteroidia bacterium]|nr:TonB-dependent receptor [Bacteroidia bacterium]
MKNSLRRIAPLLLCLFSLALPYSILAQTIHGSVSAVEEGQSVALPKAHVFWLGTKDGVLTDDHGHFHIERKRDATHLVVSHVSWETDTILVGDRLSIDVLLSVPRTTETVEVTATAPDTYVAPIPQRTEVITAQELEKAACCDLAGCFGTTSSVQPDATDVITDTRQLTMLGLGGVYTQVLVDNVPLPGDRLTRQFGIQSIPGPWVNRIMVSKGAGGVGQGSSAVSGLINVLLLEGMEENRVFFNAFGMSHLEQQYNAYVTTSVEKWNTILMLHGTRHGKRMDRDGDSFMDAPNVDRYSLLNKWTYTNEEDFTTNTGIRFAWEDRLGGQMDFNESLHRGGTDVYGQRMRNNRAEIYNRSDIGLGEGLTLRTHAIASLHELDAFYGTTSYDATQYAGFADAWLVMEPDETHTLTLGASWSWSELQENVDTGLNPLGKSYAGSYNLLESVPGVFIESKLLLYDKVLSLVTGVRADHYREYGIAMTPRLFLRYNMDEVTTLRLSAGTAFRTASVFSEYAPLFASWRDIVVPTALQPERAISYGFNAVRQYDAGGLSGMLTLDIFRTEFQNQIVADFDQRSDAVIIANLGERTTSDHLMFEATAQLPFGLGLRGSYMLTEAVEIHGGVRKLPPFISRHRALAVMTMDMFRERLTATLSAEWRSGQSLPNSALWPAEFRLPAISPAFTLLNAHLNANLGRIDVYVGVENLLDFRQSGPILNARRPFEAHFEPTFAWGPVKGREAYAGTRLRIGDY